MPETPDTRHDEDRRDFVRTTLATAVVLGIGPALGSACSPVPAGLTVLTPDEASVFDVWCNRLAPGAAEAGVSRYLDAQLAASPAEALLFLRVLANPPFEGFYRQGIAGIEQEVRERFGDGSSFVTLDEARQRQVIDAAAADRTVAWKDPPPSFFYFVSRGDAVDIAFGTESGFKRLNVPYLPHIRPSSPW